MSHGIFSVPGVSKSTPKLLCHQKRSDGPIHFTNLSSAPGARMKMMRMESR
jgi:hypothetical protein